MISRGRWRAISIWPQTMMKVMLLASSLKTATTPRWLTQTKLNISSKMLCVMNTASWKQRRAQNQAQDLREMSSATTWPRRSYRRPRPSPRAVTRSQQASSKMSDTPDSSSATHQNCKVGKMEKQMAPNRGQSKPKTLLRMIKLALRQDEVAYRKKLPKRQAQKPSQIHLSHAPHNSTTSWSRQQMRRKK